MQESVTRTQKLEELAPYQYLTEESYKIFSGALANRLFKGLPSIIHEDQNLSRGEDHL